MQINTQKSVVFLDTSNERSEREIKETITFITSSKRLKYLRINLSQGRKYPYSKIYKTLMKEIENETNRWKDIPCSWIGRINIIKMTISPKATQSQCIFYQITSDVFIVLEQTNLKICMDIQKTLNSHINLEKEKWSWRNQVL